MKTELPGQAERLDQARRRLLRFLLGMPLAAAAGLGGRTAPARPELAIPASLDEAMNVFQVEAVARRKLDRAAWHFIVNGADDMKTVAANRAAFDDWQIRVRRLVDVSRVDTSVTLLGRRLGSPILLAPVGGQAQILPEGEKAAMGAASARGHLMMVSTVSSFSVADIRAAGTAPLWFQLYASPDRALMRHLLDQAAAAGCEAVALTVDSPTRGNREGERWFARRGAGDANARSAGPMGNLAGYRGPPRIGDPALTWDIVDWLRANTRLPLLLKGIVTAEDARLARRRGVDGLIVSNHGGRQEESGRATLDCLPEVLEAVDGRMPVLIDGGFRRGTDIFKALALGATAVCVGRPYLYGLGAWGEAGAARVLSILDSELTRAMQLAGTTSLGAIGRRYLEPARRGR